MVAIAATPLFMKDVFLTLTVEGGSSAEYQCHVTEARVQAEAGARVDVQTLCTNGQFSEVGASSYTLVLSGVQDWEDNTSVLGLARYLWDNEGSEATFVLNAHAEDAVATAQTPAMNGTVTLVAADYGGAINEYATLDVELPCKEKPVLDAGV